MLSTLALTVLSCTPVHFVAPDSPQAIEQIQRLFPEACPIVADDTAAAVPSAATPATPATHAHANQAPSAAEGRSYLFRTPLLDPPEASTPAPVLRPVLPATQMRKAEAGPAHGNDWLRASRRPSPRAS